MTTETRKVVIDGISYFAGCRVRLLEMGDDPCPIEAGAVGTVTYIESESLMTSGVYGPEQTAPTLHVKWPHGRSLGMLPGIDKFVRVRRCEWDACGKDFDYMPEAGAADGAAISSSHSGRDNGRLTGFCSKTCRDAWLDDDKRYEMRMDALRDED